MCGLRFVATDAVAIINDDFQNPPEEILKLVERLSEGHDVVSTTIWTSTRSASIGAALGTEARCFSGWSSRL